MRYLILAAAAAVWWAGAARSAEVPPGIADPDVATKHWSYSDPVFFWRLTSVPSDPYEPDAYFYWPNAVIAGKPGEFLPDARAGDRTIPEATLGEMAAWAEARQSNALIVIHKGRVQLEQYWHGTTSDELINGRAITRSVTPMVLGFAVADGKLRLDDPIGRYIAEWKDDQRGKITIRQLAQNVSGLEVAEQMGVEVIYGNKDLCLAYCGDVVRAAMEYVYNIPPGTRFEVAQENMQLLALVIERAMGQPIQDILSERVWKKIGGADATFQFDRPGGVARVMCCMRATAHDWTRLGILVANGGKWNGEQVLPKGWVDVMKTPSARNPNFGLGLWLGSPYVKMRTYFEGTPGPIPQSEPFVTDDVLIMEGGGFRIVHMVPSEDLVVFRHGPFVSDWDTAFLVNTALRGLKGR